jgi:hypothetical protein
MVETIIRDTKNSYKIKKDADVMKILEKNHPEYAEVLKLAKEISKLKKVDYIKLEQLKELYDFFNPENIQFDIG